MNKKIIVALDFDNINKALKLVNELKKEAYAFKIGHEFFYNFGISDVFVSVVFCQTKCYRWKGQDFNVNNFYAIGFFSFFPLPLNYPSLKDITKIVKTFSYKCG